MVYIYRKNLKLILTFIILYLFVECGVSFSSCDTLRVKNAKNNLILNAGFERVYESLIVVLKERGDSLESEVQKSNWTADGNKGRYSLTIGFERVKRKKLG